MKEILAVVILLVSQRIREGWHLGFLVCKTIDLSRDSGTPWIICLGHKIVELLGRTSFGIIYL